MKHNRRVVVWAYDLADAVALQYGMDASDFEIANLFWPGDFMNDCCKSLGIEEGCDDYDKEEAENGDEDARLRCLVYDYLRSAFPGEDTILVDVTW